MTIALLHGFTGSPASFDDLLLGPSIAIPLTGHGALDGAADFRGEVDRIAAMLPGRCHLVGYSMGARIALGVLVEHPDLVERATLISVNPGLSSAVDRVARADADAVWIHLLERHGIAAFTAAWEALPLWKSQRSLPAVALARQRRIRLSHDPRDIADAVRALGLATMPDYGPRLADIDVPVHLIAGERDTKFRALADPMRAQLSQARVSLVPDCGHNPVLEAPGLTAALILERNHHDRMESRPGLRRHPV